MLQNACGGVRINDRLRRSMRMLIETSAAPTKKVRVLKKKTRATPNAGRNVGDTKNGEPPGIATRADTNKMVGPFRVHHRQTPGSKREAYVKQSRDGEGPEYVVKVTKAMSPDYFRIINTVVEKLTNGELKTRGEVVEYNRAIRTFAE